MKVIIAFAMVLISCSNFFGLVVVSCPDIQVLYRSYPNKIIVGSNGVSSAIVLKSETAQLTKEGNEWTAIVESGYAATIISAYANDVLLQEVTYKVKPLPNPLLYWGNSISGEEAVMGETFLNVRYDESVVLNKSFEILSWEASFDNKLLNGTGTLLSESFFDLLKSSNEDTVDVNITVNYKSVGGSIQNRTSGFFKVVVPFKSGLNLSNSNKVTIIDKTASNEDIFDVTNPTSLMGMIKTNYFPLSFGMTDFTEKRFEKEGLTVHSRTSLSLNPIASRLNPGEDSVFYDPVNDYYVTLYHPGYSKSYFIDNISRIVLFEDRIENTLTKEKYFGIKYIGLCSKANGSSKYDIVAVIPYDDLCQMKATSFFQKFEFNAYDSVAKYSSSVLEDINFYLWNDAPYNNAKTPGESGYYYGSVGSDSWFNDDENRMTLMSDINYAINHANFNYPNSFELKDSVKFDFHDLQFYQGPSDTPIKSIDPIKMENDEDSLIYDPILDMYYVQYYLGEQIIFKALADYDVYYQYLANPEDLSHPVLKCVYFAVNNGKESATVMAIPMENPNYNEELAYLQAKLASFASPPRISWRESLLEEAEKGIKLDINKSKDKKLLKTQFYLDSVEGYSMNYFGISE